MTQYLPPLANIIAMFSRDRERLSAFAGHLGTNAAVRIDRQHANWVVGSHALPKSRPDTDGIRSRGYVFAEGRDAAAPGDDVSELDRALASPDSRLLASIPGDFTFFRLNRDSLTAVRSCGGLVPVYLWESTETVVLSTHATWLARYADWRGQPDPLITALWLSGWPVFAKNRSHLEGVRILHKGERFDWMAGGAGRISRYWYPRLDSELRWPSAASVRDHQDRFREALVESLRTNLDPQGGNLLTLSGGVDSSSLLAVAAGHLRYPVKTFTLRPPKDARFHDREMGYLHALWKRYDVEHRDVEARSEEELSRQGAFPPLLFPLFNATTLGLVPAAGGDQVTVSFGGEMADEVVGSLTFTVPDWARHVPLWRLPFLLSRAPRLKRLPLHILEQQFWRRLSRRPAIPLPRSLPSWIAPRFEAELRSLHHELETYWIDAGIMEAANPGLWLRLIYMDFAPMQWEACAWLNVRRFSPFCTRALQELALQCHPAELVGPGSKRLLRGALAGMVPKEFLNRTDKGSFGLPSLASQPAARPPALGTPPWDELLAKTAAGTLRPTDHYLIALAGFYAARYRACQTAIQ